MTGIESSFLGTVFLLQIAVRIIQILRSQQNTVMVLHDLFDPAVLVQEAQPSGICELLSHQYAAFFMEGIVKYSDAK